MMPADHYLCIRPTTNIAYLGPAGMSGWTSLAVLVMLYGSTCCEQTRHHPEKQNQSNKDIQLVKRSAGDPFSRRSPVDKNFIRFGRSFHEVADRSRAKNMMSYARVSRAAKDNFMRFGRPDPELEQLYFSPTVQSAPPYRYSRAKDNFMRFGRAKDNFMRFGRGKDNFMRFGKSKPDNFMRFGRGKENFMRFGKADNFMRFGKSKSDNFMRFGKAKPDNFMRFGRPDNFMRFGRDPEVSKELLKESAPKSEDGFVRFSRADSDDQDEGKVDDGPEIDQGDLDLQADKPKNGPVIRIKRDILEPTATTLWQVEDNSKDRPSRDSEIEEPTHESLLAKRSIYPDLWVIDDEPLDEEQLEDEVEFVDKRSGDSKFIRFG